MTQQGTRSFPAATTSKAFPAANASNQSDGLQLSAPPVGGQSMARPEGLEVQLRIPAAAPLADGTELRAKLQDSADGETFADLATLAEIIVTGESGNVLPTADGAGFTVDLSGDLLIHWPIPRGFRGWVRASVELEDGAGDLTGLEYELSAVV